MAAPAKELQEIGSRLRAVREARGWKPHQLSHLLFGLGYEVSPQTIKNYEAGVSGRVDLAFFLCVAKLANVHLSDLLGLTDRPANVVPIKPVECPHCGSIREKLGPEKWAALLQLAETMSGDKPATGQARAPAHRRKAGAGR